MFTRFSRWWLFLGALFLTACNLQFNTAIQPSQGGVYALEVGFLPKEEESLEALDTSLEEFCAETQKSDELPEGSTSRVEARGDANWCIIEMPFANLDELTKYYEEMEGLTINQLEVQNGELLYDLTLAFDASELSQEGSDAEMELTWQVTMPGQVLEHNAASAQGNTLTWDIPQSGDAVNFKARSRLSGGGLPGLDANSPLAMAAGGLGLLCCCTLLLGAIGGAVFFITRRKPATPTL